MREIAGVDPTLSALWSRRRSDIEERIEELAAGFADKHGRRPNDKERIALAQRANLETREAKHESRSEAEQRTTWHGEAADLLGEQGLRIMLDTALRPTWPPPSKSPRPGSLKPPTG